MQNNKTIFVLEKMSSCLLIVCALFCAYLYGQYDGFVKGDNYATAVLTEGQPKYIFSGGGRPTYELVSEDYFFVLIVLLIIFAFHLITNGIASKLINLFFMSLAAYKCLSLFRLKKDIFDFEHFQSSYYDIVRQTIGFDIAGVIAIVGFFIIQVILIFLILNERRKY